MTRTKGLYYSFFDNNIFRHADNDNIVNFNKTYSKLTDILFLSIFGILLGSFFPSDYTTAGTIFWGIITLLTTYYLFNKNVDYKKARYVYYIMLFSSSLFYSYLVQAIGSFYVGVYFLACFLYIYVGAIVVKENNNRKKIIQKGLIPSIIILSIFSIYNIDIFFNSNTVYFLINYLCACIVAGIAGLNSIRILNDYLPMLERENARKEYAYSIASILATIPFTWIIDFYFPNKS